jgi:chloride channel protein, CIC family
MPKPEMTHIDLHDWGLPFRLLVIAGACLVGMVVGATALGLIGVIGYFNELWAVELPTQINWSDLSYSPWIGLGLLIAALIAGRLLLLITDGRPRGPADLILAAQRNEMPELKNGFLSVGLTVVSVSGGGSVGMFGPLMHFGGCFSALVSHWSKRIPLNVIMGAGAASAIAAVFSAPIGAAIFAHEAIIRRFGAFGAGPVVAAAFGAHWVAQMLVGDTRLFNVSNAPSLEMSTLYMAIAVGVLSGLVSVLYIHAVTAMPLLARKTNIPLQWRPLVPAGVLFVLSPLLPHLLGHGLGSVSMSLAGELSIALLLTLLVLKIGMTSMCIGFGLFGGVFAPALFIGAMVGGVMDSFVPGVGVSSFAILGAASCIAAVIGAPLASVMIVFELTGSYEWAVLAMISVVTANQFSRAYAGRSLFDRQLAMRGINLGDDQLAHHHTQRQ